MRLIPSILLAAVVYGVVAVFRSQTDYAVPGVVSMGVMVALIWGLLVSPAITLVSAWLTNENYRMKLSEYLGALERWTNLFYCSRDDICFVDGENETAAPERLAYLLYGSVLPERHEISEVSPTVS